MGDKASEFGGEGGKGKKMQLTLVAKFPAIAGNWESVVQLARKITGIEEKINRSFSRCNAAREKFRKTNWGKKRRHDRFHRKERVGEVCPGPWGV